MPEFTGPEREVYDGKFVRVAERIFVTKPNDTVTSHKQLAQIEGILDTLQQLRGAAPIEVDGGYFWVVGSTISIRNYSTTLGLPVPSVTLEARQRTFEVFQQKSPRYTVEKGK